MLRVTNNVSMHTTSIAYSSWLLDKLPYVCISVWHVNINKVRDTATLVHKQGLETLLNLAWNLSKRKQQNPLWLCACVLMSFECMCLSCQIAFFSNHTSIWSSQFLEEKKKVHTERNVRLYSLQLCHLHCIAAWETHYAICQWQHKPCRSFKRGMWAHG